MTLDHLDINRPAIVKSLSTAPDTRTLSGKLTDMGLYPGKEIKVLFKAPFGDPIAIDLEGYVLSLRKFEASLIEVA